MNMRNDDTLKVRMDSTTLNLMEKARAYLKIDKSKFIRQSVRQVAQAIIEENEQTRFSTEDWRSFFALIDAPFEPTKRMSKASKKYKEIKQSNGV